MANDQSERWRRGLPRAEQAAWFRGDGFVHQARAPLPDAPLTIALWVRWSDTEPADDFGPSAPVARRATLLSYQEGDDGSSDIVRIADASAITIFVGGSSLETDTAVDDFDWHHVAVSIDAADPTGYQVRCSIDGQRVGQRRLFHDAGRRIEPGGPLTIGQRFPGNDGDAFSGQIVDLCVFDHVLESGEIDRAMHREPVPGRVLWWPLAAAPDETRSANVDWTRPTNVALPEPFEHIVTVDAGAVGRAATLRGSGADLGDLLGTGSYTIDVDDYGQIDMAIGPDEVLLNGVAWRATGDLAITLDATGGFTTSEPVVAGRVVAIAELPVEVPAADAGITSRSVLTEAHPHDGHGTFDFHPDHTRQVYRTTIAVPGGTEWIDLNASPAVAASIDGHDVDLLPEGLPAHRVPVGHLGRVSIVLPADQVGTSRLALRTDRMDEDARVMVCPDVDVHRKLDALAPDAIAHERHHLGIPDADPEACGAVQAAVQNLSRTVEHTFVEAHGRTHHEPRSNPRRMSDTHFVLDVDRSGEDRHRYRAIDADEVRHHVEGAVRIDDPAGQAGLLDQIGHALAGAERVVVHTAGSVVHDVAATGRSILDDSTRTAERIGDDLVHGDLRGGLADLAHGAADLTADGERGLASLAGDVEHGAREMAVVTIHLAEELATDLGTVVQFVLDEAGKLAQAVAGLVHTIGLAVERLVEWLADELGWDAIIRTQKALRQRLLDGLDGLADDVHAVVASLVTDLEDVRTSLDAGLDATLARVAPPGRSMAPEPTATKHSVATERTEWLLGKVPSDRGDASGPGRPTDEPITTQLIGLLATTTSDPRLVHHLEQVWDDVQRAMHDPLHAASHLLPAVLAFTEAVIDVVIDLAKGAVELLGTVVTDLFTLLRAALTFDLDVPFLSPLFAAITGGETLDVLDLVTLLLAVPTTLVCRATGGGEPYPAVDQAAQGDTPAWPPAVVDLVVYGGIQLLDGVLSACLDSQWEELTVQATGGAQGVAERRVAPIRLSGAATTPHWVPGDPSRAANLAGFLSLACGVFAQLVSRPDAKAKPSAVLTWGWQWFQVLVDAAATVGPAVRAGLHGLATGSLDPATVRVAPVRFLSPPGGLVTNCVLEAVHMAIFLGQLVDDWDDAAPGKPVMHATYVVDPLKGLVAVAYVTQLPAAKAVVCISDVTTQLGYAVLCWVSAGQQLAASVDPAGVAGVAEAASGP